MAPTPTELQAFFRRPLATAEDILAARMMVLEHLATGGMSVQAAGVCLAVLVKIREELTSTPRNEAIEEAANLASRTVCSLTPCQNAACPACGMASQLGQQIRALKR